MKLPSDKEKSQKAQLARKKALDDNFVLLPKFSRRPHNKLLFEVNETMYTKKKSASMIAKSREDKTLEVAKLLTELYGQKMREERKIKDKKI